MGELHERVTARLLAAQKARDAGPLRTPEAADEAFALLREAAPDPEGTIDLDALWAVFWTFWLRHTGPYAADAARNIAVINGTFGFLHPRLPEHVVFPEPLRAAFDPADPLHDVRFAYLIAGAHGDLIGEPDIAEAERFAALERALAWSACAIGSLPPEHAGDVDLTLQAVGLQLARYQLAADPDGLIAAAEHGLVVCEALTGVDPADLDQTAAEAAVLAFGAVLDAARLLGVPSIAKAERLLALAPAGLLPPEAAQALRGVRELQERATSWPGQFGLLIGTTIAEAGVAEHDAARIACAVRRLRAALAATPADHPARPAVVAALAGALDAFARERGEAAEAEGAAAEAAELRAAGAGEVAEVEQQNLALQQAAWVATLSPVRAEAFALATEFPDNEITDERIARFRGLLADVPPEDPGRYLHVALLAALLGTRAAELRASDPARAAGPAAESAALGEQAAALAAGAGTAVTAVASGLFTVLAEGRYDMALPLAATLAAFTEPDGGFADPEMTRMISMLSRMADVRVDGQGSYDGDITIMRDLMGELTEDETVERAYLSAALGSALSARGSSTADPSSLDEVVSLLRFARTHAPEDSAATDRILAQALTILSALRFDPEAAREAAAVLAESARDGDGGGGGGAGGDGEGGPTGIAHVAFAAHTELHSALQNYILGHDQEQLDRARQVALRLKALAAEPGVREEAPELDLDLLADNYLNLLDGLGPGGGLLTGITGEQLDRCRAAFARCPPGHPGRVNAAMTLVRVLTMHALELRETDREQALRLVGEAGHCVDAMTPDVTQDWTDLMRYQVTLVAARVLGLPQLPAPPAHLAGDTGQDPADPADAMGAMAARMISGLFGAADLSAIGGITNADGLTVSPWYQAHHEIGRAAGALKGPEPRVDVALDHLEAAVELLPRVTDRGSDQQSAEHGLTSFDGDLRGITELVLLRIALRDTARRAEEFRSVLKAGGEPPALPAGLTPEGFRIAAGPDVDRAAEVLERGRGLLLSRRIEARADLGGLRAVHPEAADEFERLTDLLAGAGAESIGAVPERARLERLHASRALDELIGRIRELPEFGDFLRPLTAGQLRGLAADGPVVLLHQGPHYCHALVVTGESITALFLEPETAELAATARELRGAVDAINARGADRPSPVGLVAAAATARRSLSWTWHRIVRPVLDHLGIDGTTPAEGRAGWPRIWWVPTRAFNSLPLHAAQCTGADCAAVSSGDGSPEHPDRCGAALDLVVSSYAPGFQTLAYARSRAEHRGSGASDGAALLVAAPEEELPGVAGAARYAAELLRAPAPLIGAAATRAVVLDALAGTPWAHFGCHAAADPAEPSGARLHLPSGEQLSVLEICRARPDAARLAFLAACGTARSSERLSDEAIHITGAFLLAGFPAAVGTLWEIGSDHADHVTRDFYRRVTAVTAADTGPGASALALHHTVRALRRRIPDGPHVWAAYVHAGA
ncbi:CHAT domain-containing protein [Kitasatospora sp. NPDC093806]|uniref:CHAT domain-containing protein n=1 Tax=Kitasatospora sp. NPDC093806 TaxID=3155075 RepID=UPI003430D075